MSSIFLDGGSVVAWGALGASVDWANASVSADGVAIDWTLAVETDGEDAWEVCSAASLHPEIETQRIRDRISGIKRFMFISSF